MAKSKNDVEKEEFIRTPTKISGPLTEDEKVRLKVHTDEWNKNAFRCDNVDPEKIIPAIEGIYVTAGLTKPKVVIASSPLVMAFAFGAASHLLNEDETSSKKKKNSKMKVSQEREFNGSETPTKETVDVIGDSITSALQIEKNDHCLPNNESVYDRVISVVEEIMNSFGGMPKFVSHTNVKSLSTERQAYQACFDIAGQDGINAAKTWYNNHQGGNMWSYYDCYLTAFRDVLGLDIPIYEKYKFWEVATKEGGFRVMHEKFCIVSNFPDLLKIDDNNRPHSENGPSYRWRDGWSLYYWHGVKIPSEWLENKSSITPQMALTWENMEQGRAACEILGWANILQELNATIIDEDGDPEIGQLLEVDIPEIGREKFLKVLCGTGRTFALPVPPEMKTALQAQAWTFGMDENIFARPEIRT